MPETQSPAARTHLVDWRRLAIFNPFVLLILVAILSLVAAIFVFGTHGRYTHASWADVFRTIGIGTLSAAVTILVDRNMVYQNFEKKIKESLVEACGVAESLSNLGVTSAHPTFSFNKLFREAHRGDCIYWLDTYCPRQNEFVDDLIEAINRGVSVKMLVIDPACDNARHRNTELAATVVETGAGWDTGLDAFVAKMKALCDKHPGKLEMRTYNDLPCAPMYLVVTDSKARVGFFSLFLVRASAHSPHMELHDGPWLTDMHQYFEDKWTRHAPAEKGAAA